MDNQHCFLSYARADEDFAVRLASDLRALGVAMWVDRHDIRVREHWDKAIERAIRGCRSFVVILSPRAIASDNVADEISLAIDSGKSVIPVMIERCDLPLRLTRRHLIDATRGYDGALKQCLAAIRDDLGGVSGASADPTPMIFDPEVLTAVRQQLAVSIGPIAGMLVERAAGRATSLGGLYELLAPHIADDAERARFLASAGASASAPEGAGPVAAIEAGEVDRIARILTRYVGPVATILVRKEGRAAGSARDLVRRLATRLPSSGERDGFLRLAEIR